MLPRHNLPYPNYKESFQNVFLVTPRQCSQGRSEPTWTVSQLVSPNRLLIPRWSRAPQHAGLPGARRPGEAARGPRLRPVPLEHRWVWSELGKCLVCVLSVGIRCALQAGNHQHFRPESSMRLAEMAIITTPSLVLFRLFASVPFTQQNYLPCHCSHSCPNIVFSFLGLEISFLLLLHDPFCTHLPD